MKYESAAEGLVILVSSGHIELDALAGSGNERQLHRRVRAAECVRDRLAAAIDTGEWHQDRFTARDLNIIWLVECNRRVDREREFLRTVILRFIRAIGRANA